MPAADPDPKEISIHREIIEARLSDLLQQSGHTARLKDIKTLIYELSHRDFNLYIERLRAICKSPESTVDIDTALPVIQDAWNYFPHRSLNGQCPAELLSLVTAAHVMFPQLPDIEDVEFDADKIDDAVLALLLLGLHANSRVWKGHDWTALDHLFEKGYITDPRRQAKSVVLTKSGLAEAQRLFKELFAC